MYDKGPSELSRENVIMEYEGPKGIPISKPDDREDFWLRIDSLGLIWLASSYNLDIHRVKQRETKIKNKNRSPAMPMDNVKQTNQAEDYTRLLPDVKILAAVNFKIKIEASLITASSIKAIGFTKILGENFKRIHLKCATYNK